MAKPSMSVSQIEELRCLCKSNDATGKPSAIHQHHWSAGIRYDMMASAGYVKRYARPPKGFGQKFFGVKITVAGREFLDRLATT